MKSKFKVGDLVRAIKITGDLKSGKVYKVDYVDPYYIGVGPTGKYFTERFIKAYNGTATLRPAKSGFRFNLVAANNEKIATSEVYTTKAMALKTIQKYFPDFEIVDKTKPRAK